MRLGNHTPDKICINMHARYFPGRAFDVKHISQKYGNLYKDVLAPMLHVHVAKCMWLACSFLAMGHELCSYVALCADLSTRLMPHVKISLRTHVPNSLSDRVCARLLYLDYGIHPSKARVWLKIILKLIIKYTCTHPNCIIDDFHSKFSLFTNKL